MSTTTDTPTTTLSAFCPYFHNAVELIGRRWTGAILRAMLAGRCRFSDISDAIPGLSDRLLSERLKELEAAGVVVRTVYPETPVRITYSLTEKGLDLSKVMDAIAQWAHDWPAELPEDVTEEVTGHRLQVTGE